MSKERELLERAYYVLGELSYAMLKDSGEYNLAGDIYEFLSTPEPTQDEEPNKEKALELAHRWCSRYRHGEEFPYLFNEYHLLEFVRRLYPTPEPTQDEPVDISGKSEPTIGSILILPNGAVISNVYEAYEAGLKERTRQDEEPVAWMKEDKDGDLEFNTLNQFSCGRTNGIPLYLRPAPRKLFVRLSEEEIMEIVRSDDEFDEMMLDDTSIRFARAVENRLVEKNK